MTTLTGDASFTGLNYYNGNNISVDLGSAGFEHGTQWSFTLQITATTCTDQIDVEVMLQRPLPDTEFCFHWQDITPSGAPLHTFSYGPANVGVGVEWTGTAGASGCIDFTRILFYVKPYTYPGACDISIHYSVTFTPLSGMVPLCAYGTMRKPGVDQIAIISTGLLLTAGIISFQWWMVPLMGSMLGSAIAVDDLCSTLKHTDVTIDPVDWTTADPSGIGTVAQHKFLLNVTNALWDFFCQCVPAPSGSPAPVSPPVTIITKPTYISVYEDNHIDNTEISTTINDVWNYLLSINVGNNNSISLGQQVATCTCTDFKLGSAHEGLSGDGTFVVSGIHGLSVTFTTLPARTGVDIGDPDRIYDVGWVNVGNDWGWQPPMYPNTSKWIVFPPDMHQMTRVGYSIPEDVVLTIAELVTA